MNTKTQ